MSNTLKTLKLLTPPIVFALKQKLFPLQKKPAVWSGNYNNWQQAEALCTGYDSSIILEKCKNALLQVKNETAVYERDSVLFAEIQYSWGLLAGLQKVALANNGDLSVVDFGGSLGSTYYQNREFLKEVQRLSWNIVEQPHFVDCGKENFADNQLQFFHTLKECISEKQPKVLLLSGVLQYLSNADEWLNQFNNSSIDYILIDRTTEIKDGNIISIQKVPEDIYQASYPCWFFNNHFIKSKLTNYQLIASFPGAFDPVNYLLNDTVLANWNGYLFKRK